MLVLANIYKEITYTNLNSSNKLDFSSSIENKVDFNKNKKSFTTKNFYLFFISEFGFFTILFSTIYLFKFIPKYHQPKTFFSKTNKNFNSNEEPKIFLHLTDIHISKTRPAKSDGSLIFLSSILKYEPDFILLTGDIVDNFRGEFHWHRVGIQNDDDWNIYNKAVKKMMSRFPVIDVAGNHDVWAVDSVISKENKFLDNSFMYNRSSVLKDSDFTVKKIEISNLTFILFNDYRFPTPRPPYGNEPYTNREQLDLLENMVDELGQKECFILTHYNVDRMWYITSSQGHTFQEIISKKNVYAIFTGHRHPNQVEIIHHGDIGGLEYCTSSSFDKKRGGLITIDNENVVYHDVYIPFPGEETKFFLTYPVPNEQVSSHHVFNLNQFEIRVISFIKDKNIQLKIKGDIQGELKYKMTLKNGAFLYTYPVNLKDGNYKIQIYDENGYSCDINTEFTIGRKYEGKKEKVLNFFYYYLIIRFSSIFFFIYILIIIFPLKSNTTFQIIYKLENYINGKDSSQNYNLFLLVFLIIFLSPFILRRRYQKCNLIIKIAILFATIYPLILPIHFFENINGKIGFVINAFTIVGSSIRYEHWCIQMAYMFYISVIFPYIIYLSGYSYHKRSKKLKYINFTITSIIFIISFYIHIYSMAQSISILFLLLSSGNVICWIFILIIVNIFNNKKKFDSLTKRITIVN